VSEDEATKRNEAQVAAPSPRLHAVMEDAVLRDTALTIKGWAVRGTARCKYCAARQTRSASPRPSLGAWLRAFPAHPPRQHMTHAHVTTALD